MLKTNVKEKWFDFVVIDQHVGPGLKGSDVAGFIILYHDGVINSILFQIGCLNN